MRYYILVLGEMQTVRGTVSGKAICRHLAKRKKWYFAELTPKVRGLEPHDMVLIYLAGRGMRFFAGEARVAGHPRPLDLKERKFLESVGIRAFQFFAPLDEVTLWKEPRPITLLLNNLTFIRDTRNYGGLLRHGIREISRSDYELIAKFAPQGR